MFWMFDDLLTIFGAKTEMWHHNFSLLFCFFSNVYFSSGPGSFTALRSLKAISQALALSSNSDLLSTSSFSALLASIQIKEKNVIACFKSTNNKFFYQFFERTGRIFKPKYELKFADESQLIFYFFEKKKITMIYFY